MNLSLRATLLALGIVSLAWPTDKGYRTLKTAEMLQMLDTIKADIKNYYYDAAMHGVDLDSRFDKAKKEIVAAKSEGEGLLDVAAAVAALNDSHTNFSPPGRPYGVDYGWRMQAIGESACFATAVRPDSDAMAKGLRPGDEILSVKGVSLTRQDIGFIEYAYHVFPQSGLRLLVRSPDGAERSMVTMATVIPGQTIIRHSDAMAWLSHHHDEGDRSQYYHNNEVLFWRWPDFMVEPKSVDGLLNRTRSYKAVVLDLRGNSGGLSEALDRFIGGFFDHDVRLGYLKGRQDPQTEVARSRQDKAFGGALIVLVDSKTGSAAEVFARIVQLEKRGTVLGDRSRGAVMRGRMYMHAVNLDATNVAMYGAEISTADLIMSDGKSIENVGVIPDEKILPNPTDIAQGKDPVLARAAELAGIKMTSDEAGKIFPLQWPKERPLEID